MYRVASLLVGSILALGSGSAVHSQIPLDDMCALVNARTVAPADIFDGAFRPETVFRERTLVQWITRLRDADTQGTAAPARKAFLDMGEKAVPFLLRAHARLEWDEAGLGYEPLQICEAMGDRVVPALVRMLGSEHAISAWWILFGKITDACVTDEFRNSDEYRKQTDQKLSKLRALLVPCLGSADAPTRYAALNLLEHMPGQRSNKEWENIAAGARRLMGSDPANAVRGAACTLLGELGRVGVKGGLTKTDVEELLKDQTLPQEVRAAAGSGLLMRMWFASRASATPPVK